MEQNYSDYFNARKSMGSHSLIYCVYCTKTDFQTLDQLHGHIQSMHATALCEVIIIIACFCRARVTQQFAFKFEF